MKSFIECFLFLGLLVLINGHVTIPHTSIISAGETVYVQISIPHSEPGKYTSRLEVSIPHGILAVKPQELYGWNITYINRDLPPSEYYVDHGINITTAIASIVFQAQDAQYAFSNDLIQRIGLSIKLGCLYDELNSSTIWGGHYALWFPTVQSYSDFNTLSISGTASWTGIVQGNQAWSEGYPSPAPYILIEYWEACNVATYKNQFFFFGVVPFTGREKLSTVPDVAEWLSGQLLTVDNKIGGLQTRVDVLAAIVAASTGTGTGTGTGNVDTGSASGTGTGQTDNTNTLNNNGDGDGDGNDSKVQGLIGGLIVVAIVLFLIIIVLFVALVAVYFILSRRIKKIYDKS